jgi:hypothetical protein
MKTLVVSHLYILRGQFGAIGIGRVGRRPPTPKPHKFDAILEGGKPRNQNPA